MSTRRRFATAIIAVTTAASMATAPAMAQADDANGSLTDIQGQLGAAGSLITGSLIAPINQQLLDWGSFETEEEAQGSTLLAAGVASIVTPIAVAIAIGVGVYTYAQSQGWVQ